MRGNCEEGENVREKRGVGGLWGVVEGVCEGVRGSCE